MGLAQHVGERADDDFLGVNVYAKVNAWVGMNCMIGFEMVTRGRVSDEFSESG